MRTNFFPSLVIYLPTVCFSLRERQEREHTNKSKKKLLHKILFFLKKKEEEREQQIPYIQCEL